MRFEVLTAVIVAVWTCRYPEDGDSIFLPEDGGSIFLRNTDTHLQVHTALQLRRPLSAPITPSHKVYIIIHEVEKCC
jgi:hypothetical protein